jgi:hypothetical protein
MIVIVHKMPSANFKVDLEIRHLDDKPFRLLPSNGIG